MKLNKQQLIIIAIFAGLSILASRINFAPFVAGHNLKFTFFDMYAPIAGGLFGSLAGMVAVFAVEVYNLLFRQTFSLAAILHLFPVIFGAWYFGSNKKLVNLVPFIAIIGFVANPVSREVWHYSLFWLIPIVCHKFKERSLVARSLGATFTAHAAGGLLWIYFFNPPAAVWNSLIPIVIMERTIFALVSVVTYVLIQKIISYAIPAYQNAAHAAAER